MPYTEPTRFTAVEFSHFTKFVKQLDKERGNTYALGVIRGATYLKKLSTEQQSEIIRAVLLT